MKYFGFVLVLSAIFVGIGFLGSRLNKEPIESSSTPEPIAQSQVSESLQASAIIRLTNEGYVPNRVSIKAGEAVKFMNEASDTRWPASNIHPTHEIYPEFDPKKPILPGESWSFAFDRAGEWRFHDHLYPQITGVIIAE